MNLGSFLPDWAPPLENTASQLPHPATYGWQLTGKLRAWWLRGCGGRDGQGHWGPSLAAPDHWLHGGLQADFHVQGVGTRKVDFDVAVTDDDLICQVEGVAICGMGFIPLYWGVGVGERGMRI